MKIMFYLSMPGTIDISKPVIFVEGELGRALHVQHQGIKNVFSMQAEQKAYVPKIKKHLFKCS